MLLMQYIFNVNINCNFFKIVIKSWHRKVDETFIVTRRTDYAFRAKQYSSTSKLYFWTDMVKNQMTVGSLEQLGSESFEKQHTRVNTLITPLM